MECHMTCAARCYTNKQGSWFSRKARKLGRENIHSVPGNVAICNLRLRFQSLTYPHYGSIGKYPICHPSWRTFCTTVSLEKESSSLSPKDYSSNDDEFAPKEIPETVLAQPLDCNELKSLLADSERTKLIRKLSEANQHNRFLKRQLQIKDDDLVNFKSELAVIELEIQALVALAEEIANTGSLQGSRKINGKYIQSHLLARLEAVQKKLKEQVKDVAVVQSKEVPLVWCGMAESVQVMGTFDGWSQGEHLSPEYTSSFTKFSTTLMLRPGRYEIKFLVDGEWTLSPEFPTIGEGLTKNNLLVVE
ncbi:hypothetical protein HHK36_029962 [Tetracentron sinense]|uniref:AMP-activated protein kinase glycogen-binding domain-containing protein n=1 Tax=Tetracentron sinense TaxID=13715 RepID=A0A834YCL8_TETSI|nr:hypothetical protein HHK36_029962 [Tetracentron sinense]